MRKYLEEWGKSKKGLRTNQIINKVANVKKHGAEKMDSDQGGHRGI